jgi:hypothetical protein
MEPQKSQNMLMKLLNPIMPPQTPQTFFGLPGMPKVYGQEERYGFKSLFLTHRQKAMRDLLDKRDDVILQGNDLKTWKQTERN